MFAAIHHNPNKQASATFWRNGQFQRVNLGYQKDRAAAMTHIKAYYRGATQVSIVFFVPAKTEE